MKVWRRAFYVEGLNVERFIHAAEEQGITLYEMRRCGDKRIAAAAPEDVFPMLDSIAIQGGWTFIKGKRQGMGRAADVLRYRWLLVLIFLLCCCLVMLATRFMWRIRVTDAGVYAADIHAALEEMDIRPPMLRSKVDPARIQAALEWRYPMAAWVECGWRGTTLSIRIIDGYTAQGTSDASSSSAIIAGRDGIIESIVTAAGTPVVSPGEIVRKGQVLIKGEERTSNGEYRPVSAQGCVMAHVWDTVQVQTPLYGIETDYTGRSQVVQSVACPWFPLATNDQSPYELQDVSISTMPLGGLFIPVYVRTEKRLECTLNREMQDLERLIADGEAASIRKLRQSAAADESYVDIWVNWSIIDDEILLSEAVGERLMDIAQQECCSGMAATE